MTLTKQAFQSFEYLNNTPLDGGYACVDLKMVETLSMKK